MSRRRSLWFVIATVACGVTCAAEQWPRWRGADAAGNGGDVMFPHEWPDDAWAWTADLPGVGHASPVVWGGRVYTAAADEQGRTRFVLCHRLADGEREWMREIGGPIDRHRAQNSSASGSVAVGQRGVYWLWAASDGLRVEAFTHDGEPLWHVDLGPFVGEHGFGATAAVCDDIVIVPNDQDGVSFVVGLDAATGRERWRLPRTSQKAGYATPLVVSGERQPFVVLTSMAHGFTAIEPVTGRVLWEQAAFSKRTVSSPVRIGPLVVGTCGEGGGDNMLVAVRLPEPGGGPPAVAYQLDRSVAPYVPTPGGLVPIDVIQWAISKEITDDFQLFVHGFQNESALPRLSAQTVIGDGFLWYPSDQFSVFGNWGEATDVNGPATTFQLGAANAF